MKQELTKIKAKQPNITHKAAFTEAAQRVSDNKNLFENKNKIIKRQKMRKRY